MKKILIIASLCLSTGLVNAQSLTAASTIVDSHNATIGYMKGETVEDSHHKTLGHIKKDGTIEDSHHNTIGYVKTDGTIEDSHHKTIGKATGFATNEVLKTFFFKS